MRLGWSRTPVKYTAPVSSLSTFSWAGAIKIVTCQPEKNRKKVYSGENLHAHWGCLSLAEEAGVKCSAGRKAWRRLVAFWVAASSDSDFLICPCYLFSWPWFEIAWHSGSTVILSLFKEKKEKKTLPLSLLMNFDFRDSCFFVPSPSSQWYYPGLGWILAQIVKTIQNWGLNYGQRVEFYSGFWEALGQQLLIKWIILAWVGSVIEVEGDFFFLLKNGFANLFQSW